MVVVVVVVVVVAVLAPAPAPPPVALMIYSRNSSRRSNSAQGSARIARVVGAAARCDGGASRCAALARNRNQAMEELETEIR